MIQGILEGLGDKDRRGSKGFSRQKYVFSEGLGDKESRSSQGLSRQLNKRSFQRRFLMFKNKVIRIERVLRRFRQDT